MICPSCGADVPATKFCENCGSSLAAAQEQAVSPTQPDDLAAGFATAPAYPVGGVTEPVSGSSFPADQPTVPVEPAYTPEVPGDSAWVAKPQQAYQVDQTLQMPPQPSQVGTGYVPPAAGGQAPYAPSAPYQATSSGNRAPNAAFVLVIVGLILSVLFVTFLPGLVCSIIGLVLNAGYNKKGLDNPRKTSTMVIGIIGVVIAVLCAVFSIIVGITAAQVVSELDKQGVDITTDSVQVSADSSGNINVTVKDSSSSADAAESINAVSSNASASSAASASANVPPADYDDLKFHDSEYNPTLYSVVELTGAEMQDVLESYNYYWDDGIASWYASDGSLYGVEGLSGSLSKDQIEALPKGASGQPVAIVLTVEGYDTPDAAFRAATKDIVVEDQYKSGDLLFAVVYGSPMVEYLVAVSQTDPNEQSFLLFTNEAISDGLFESMTGVNAGSSIDEVWKAIKG